jgi:hypothetical protein
MAGKGSPLIGTPSFSSVVAAYMKDLEKGQAPPEKELLARYPELADELQAFFAGHILFDRLLQPERLRHEDPVMSQLLARYVWDYGPLRLRPSGWVIPWIHLAYPGRSPGLRAVSPSD